MGTLKAEGTERKTEVSGGKNDEMFRGVWKAVETGTGEVRVAEAEAGRKREESEKRKQRGKKTVKIKRVAEEWEIWNEEEEVVRSEEEVKELVPEKFHQ